MARETTSGERNPERERERRRLREEEEKDLEVEQTRGARPLEGYAGGHTTWTGLQDDRAAAKEHSRDAELSMKESEEQVHRFDPVEDAGREEREG